MAHSIALAELISYLEYSRIKGEIKVHKLSSLVKEYSVRLAQLGADSDQHVHATRLKNRFTTHIPELRAISNGREVQQGGKIFWLLRLCLHFMRVCLYFERVCFRFSWEPIIRLLNFT